MSLASARLDNLSAHEGKEVLIRGWAYNIRSSGKIIFAQIRDGYGFIQAVIAEGSIKGGAWEEASTLTAESSVELHGTITKHPKQDAWELQVSSLAIIQKAEEYPIGKKEHGVDFLMDQRHLWLRAPRQWAILRIRNTLIQAIYEFMAQEGFIKIDAPILTPNACEGTTELFAIDYFGETAYLSQSGQLYIESAIFAHNKVFDFGPVFRAEKSKTRRHLTEFWMMDAEVAFANHEDNIKLQEKFISHLTAVVLSRNAHELSILERDTKILEAIKPPFIRMTHKEAVQELRKLGSDIKADDDLGGDDETLLTKTHTKPIFIEKYPAPVKAFYMKRDPQDETRVLCDDLLAPEGYGEIIGGSEREDDYAILKKRIEDHGLPVKDFEWYLDLRKYGSVPHAGFGLGLERMVSWVCGLQHVRETIPFARTITRLRP